MSSFFDSRLSFSSSFLSVFTGPSVTANPDFPRRMLSFKVSGATYFSGWVLRKFPNLERNSGCAPVLTSGAGRDLSWLRKSTGAFDVVFGDDSGLLGDGALMDFARDLEIACVGVEGVSLVVDTVGVSMPLVEMSWVFSLATDGTSRGLDVLF